MPPDALDDGPKYCGLRKRILAILALNVVVGLSMSVYIAMKNQSGPDFSAVTNEWSGVYTSTEAFRVKRPLNPLIKGDQVARLASVLPTVIRPSWNPVSIVLAQRRPERVKTSTGMQTTFYNDDCTIQLYEDVTTPGKRFVRINIKDGTGIVSWNRGSQVVATSEDYEERLREVIYGPEDE